MSDYKAMHKAAAEREIGLAMASSAQSRSYETELHHEESHIAASLPREEDRRNDRLVNRKLEEYLVGHEEKIRTAIREVLASPEFTADRPVVIKLSTALGDHPPVGDLRDEISASAANMHRDLVVLPTGPDEDERVVFEHLPIEAYCFKADETGSQRGKFTAYIARLVNADDNNDTLVVTRHPDITDTGLLGLLDKLRVAERVSGSQEKFIMKSAQIYIPESTSRLTRYELVDPELDRIRQQSIVSGRKTVENFLSRARKTMTPKRVSRQVLR
jgi:hypothetical protein